MLWKKRINLLRLEEKTKQKTQNKGTNYVVVQELIHDLHPFNIIYSSSTFVQNPLIYIYWYLYSAECTVSEYCTLRTMNIVKCKLYNVHVTVYSVHYILYSIYCTGYSIQSKV